MTESVAENATVGLAQFRRSLSAADQRSLAGMYGIIIFLHLVGFIVLFALVIPNHYHLGGDHPVFTDRCWRPGLHTGPTTCLRRRPHRRRRQHHPQTHRGQPRGRNRQKASLGWLLVLTRPLDHRLHPLRSPVRGRQGARRTGRGRRLHTAHHHRTHRAVGVGNFPVDPRDLEPRRPHRHLQSVPTDATGPLRRSPHWRSISTPADS